VTKIPANI